MQAVYKEIVCKVFSNFMDFIVFFCGSSEYGDSHEYAGARSRIQH